jgi:hypothetical protein
MQAEFVALLKSLERRIGWPINSITRCRQAEHWLKKYDVSISYSTLSRLYGLNGRIVTPRMQTLDEIARAVGFSDFDTFQKSTEPRPSIIRFQNDALFQMEILLAGGRAIDAVSLYLDALKADLGNSFLSLHLGKVLYSNPDQYRSALKWLASEPLSRSYFYQFYIDEDDINGAYLDTLSQIFVKDANPREQLFVRLYQARRKSWRGDVIHLQEVNEMISLADEDDSLHLKARAWEVWNLQEWLRNGKVNEKRWMEIIAKALTYLNVGEFGGEECALVGRLCRAMLLTNSERLAFENHQWITYCRQVVYGSFSDLEFQSAAQRFLQQGSHFLSNEQMIYQSDWPNAYYTSQLFLQSSEMIEKNRKWFGQLLKIDDRLMSNIIMNENSKGVNSQ